MQPSMFNVRVPIEGHDDVFLMNTFTDAQLVVSQDVADVLDRVGTAGSHFSPEERDAIATLADNGFIVASRESDHQRLDEFFRDVREDASQFRLTVLTTLQCNFACDYCIQGDHGDYNKHAAKMSLATAARAAEWAEERLDALGSSSFALTFFGGEPLLNLPVLFYLSERLAAGCRARGVQMAVNIITNGLLLTPEVVDRLVPLGLNGIKVTLDGDRDTHNRMRPLRGGQGTFDKIVHNIRQVAGKCRISIGGNFDEGSVGSYPALLDFLREQEFAGQLSKVAFKPIIKPPQPAARKGLIPLTPIGERRKAARRRLHDVRRHRRIQHLRQLPLPRREDDLPARGNAASRIPDDGWRAHGAVRNPQAPRPHHRAGRLALRLPGLRGRGDAIDGAHRRS